MEQTKNHKEITFKIPDELYEKIQETLETENKTIEIFISELITTSFKSSSKKIESNITEPYSKLIGKLETLTTEQIKILTNFTEETKVQKEEIKDTRQELYSVKNLSDSIERLSQIFEVKLDKYSKKVEDKTLDIAKTSDKFLYHLREERADTVRKGKQYLMYSTAFFIFLTASIIGLNYFKIFYPDPTWFKQALMEKKEDSSDPKSH